MPTDPSEPAPERTIAKSSPRCAASERKKDRSARLPTRLVELGNREVLIDDQELPVGRDNVDMARLERNASGHLGHRHARSSRKDVRQFALVLGVKMNDDYERRLDIIVQTLEKRLQRMHSFRGGSDADGRETLGMSFFRRNFWMRGRLIVFLHSQQPPCRRGGASLISGVRLEEPLGRPSLVPVHERQAIEII